MSENSDLQRLRQEYSDREHRSTNKTLYSAFNPAALFAIQLRQQTILKTLYQHDIHDLSELRILEMGCGNGRVLAEFLTFGCDPVNLHGLDLLFPRLKEARHKLPTSLMINADGQHIPYANGTFDMVLQFTAFSSILDDQIRHNMASDILRVLKPGGMILWYDFWLNPTNKQTRGIRPSEIRYLFPECIFTFHKITLAPPIARRIVPLSIGLSNILESLKIFNSHYLVLISKQTL